MMAQCTAIIYTYTHTDTASHDIINVSYVYGIQRHSSHTGRSEVAVIVTFNNVASGILYTVDVGV